MTTTYQLIFRGETLEGQHPAVVRKRLALALKLDDARIQALFSGGAVVVRKSVDEETAAKFQAVFRKAGARLRVVTVAASGAVPSPAASGPDDAAWEILPPGSDVLDPGQRKPFVARNIDTSHLALARQLAFLPPQEPYDPAAIIAPEFEVLPVGSRLGDGSELQPSMPGLDMDFELAEPGALMAAPKPPVDRLRIPEPTFAIAEPGTRMSEPSPPPPPAPDVSHIRLK